MIVGALLDVTIHPSVMCGLSDDKMRLRRGRRSEAERGRGIASCAMMREMMAPCLAEVWLCIPTYIVRL